MSTFDPHSSPGGVIWCGADFPEALRGSFLVPRFGNLLGPPAAPEDVGFDLLSVRVEKREDGRLTARVRTVLAPLARPLDVLAIGGGTRAHPRIHAPDGFQEQAWLAARPHPGIGSQRRSQLKFRLDDCLTTMHHRYIANALPICGSS